jgi:transcription antitermination factor NusG
MSFPHFAHQADNTDPARWFAVRVRSRQEKSAAAIMKSKGLETFLPLYPSPRSGPGAGRQALLPLLPGYLFCKFDPARRLSVLLTRGVVGVIGIGNRPEPWDDSEIAAIRTLYDSGAPLKPWTDSTPGHWSQIDCGLLSGLQSLVCHSKERDHIVIRLCRLQRSIAMEIGRDSAAPGLIHNLPDFAGRFATVNSEK